jgi:hypothetical protein
MRGLPPKISRFHRKSLMGNRVLYRRPFPQRGSSTLRLHLGSQLLLEGSDLVRRGLVAGRGLARRTPLQEQKQRHRQHKQHP